jgi:hypothetical protein
MTSAFAQKRGAAPAAEWAAPCHLADSFVQSIRFDFRANIFVERFYVASGRPRLSTQETVVRGRPTCSPIARCDNPS